MNVFVSAKNWFVLRCSCGRKKVVCVFCSLQKMCPYCEMGPPGSFKTYKEIKKERRMLLNGF